MTSCGSHQCWNPVVRSPSPSCWVWQLRTSRLRGKERSFIPNNVACAVFVLFMSLYQSHPVKIIHVEPMQKNNGFRYHSHSAACMDSSNLSTPSPLVRCNQLSCPWFRTLVLSVNPKKWVTVPWFSCCKQACSCVSFQVLFCPTWLICRNIHLLQLVCCCCSLVYLFLKVEQDLLILPFPPTLVEVLERLYLVRQLMFLPYLIMSGHIEFTNGGHTACVSEPPHWACAAGLGCTLHDIMVFRHRLPFEILLTLTPFKCRENTSARLVSDISNTHCSGNIVTFY